MCAHRGDAHGSVEVVSGAVVDVSSGRIAASRRELAALVDWAEGRGDPDDPVVAGLVDAGLIERETIHPALQPVVGVLGRVHARAAVRCWRGDARSVVEILAGRAGVLVLPAGSDLDALQELRWHPRPSALPRLLAGVADITARDGPPPVDAAPRSWDDFLAVATNPASGVSLADVRWSPRPGTPLATALVLAWGATGGIGEIVPADRDPAVMTCRGRHPVEVWTGLTQLARPWC